MQIVTPALTLMHTDANEVLQSGRDLSPQHAYLVPITPEACLAIDATAGAIRAFPFRVGRDFRDPDRCSFILRERRRGASSGPNDLYLPEKGSRIHLSREHFLIMEKNGRYFLEDRGSACGTLVERCFLGGARQGGWCELSHADVIIPGGSGSRFVFKFSVRPPIEACPGSGGTCDPTPGEPGAALAGRTGPTHG